MEDSSRDGALVGQSEGTVPSSVLLPALLFFAATSSTSDSFQDFFAFPLSSKDVSSFASCRVSSECSHDLISCSYHINKHYQFEDIGIEVFFNESSGDLSQRQWRSLGCIVLCRRSTRACEDAVTIEPAGHICRGKSKTLFDAFISVSF